MSLMESASCESAAYRFPSGRFSTRLESSRGLRDKTNAALYRGWDTEAVCVTAKRLSIRISLGSRSGAFCCYVFSPRCGADPPLWNLMLPARADHTHTGKMLITPHHHIRDGPGDTRVSGATHHVIRDSTSGWLGPGVPLNRHGEAMGWGAFIVPCL